METRSKIYVAGHSGMVGSAIVRKLQSLGFTNIVTRSHKELDLIDPAQVNAFFKSEKPEYVFVAAAKVGGIYFNSKFKADFLYDNVMISANVIHAAHEYNAQKLLYLGSSCIYPRLAPQPMPESSLLTSELEKTNEGYALAKIVGLKLCEYYQTQYGKRMISAMPTNLYGPNDNFHPEHSHVIPALMRKAHEAKVRGDSEIPIWGTGKPFREILHVDDLAEAIVFLMDKYESPETINIGVGEDLSIKDLAQLVCDVIGFKGKLAFDPSKPDGHPRKLLDVTKIQNLGWKAKISLRDGLKSTYEWALKNGVLK